MASTVTLNSDKFEGFKFGTVSLGTYAAGGVAVTGTQVGCPESLVHLQVGPAGGYVAEYTGGKVKVYLQDYDLASADAALVEAGSIDLSSIKFPFIAFGY